MPRTVHKQYNVSTAMLTATAAPDDDDVLSSSVTGAASSSFTADLRQNGRGRGSEVHK